MIILCTTVYLSYLNKYYSNLFVYKFMNTRILMNLIRVFKYIQIIRIIIYDFNHYFALSMITYAKTYNIF